MITIFKPTLIAAALLTTMMLTTISASAAPVLSLSDKGIGIEVDGIKGFTIDFPRLISQDKATEHKVTNTKIDGQTATLNYDGGGQIVVDVSNPTQIALAFSELPANLKGYQMQAAIPVGEVAGRTWRLKDKTGEFPTEKAENPRLFQGSSKTFQISKSETQNVTFTPPDFSYLELVDGREWGRKAFLWKITAPYNKDWKTSTIKIEVAETIKQP